jgi:hypothetical protein
MNGGSDRSGAGPIRAVVILSLVLGSAALGAHLSREFTRQKRCARNLQQIYLALEMYEIDRGTLPTLALFPDDPQSDSDSLLEVLKRYGIRGDLCVCPALPASLRGMGLTYIWNVRLNGKKLLEPGIQDWMMVEISALSGQVSPPHLGRYNILYTDGTVEQASRLPPDIRMP